MYVPKVPRRYDFCGCPPCGLCFDWVEPVPPEEVKKEDPLAPPVDAGYRIDGVRKMVEDIVGPNSTEEQRRQIYEGAVLVHEKNLLNSKKTPLELNQEIIDQSFTAQGVESFLKQKRIEAAVVRKPVNTVTCDSIADEEAKKPEKEKVKEEVKEKIKNNVPVRTSPNAPIIDDGLLRRERKYATSRPSAEAREAMMKRYRDQMEAEKARWQAKLGSWYSDEPYRR